MGVPAHDYRDLLFANEHGLPVVKVIEVPEGSSEGRKEREEEQSGILVNSGLFTGMSVEEGRKEIAPPCREGGIWWSHDSVQATGLVDFEATLLGYTNPCALL